MDTESVNRPSLAAGTSGKSRSVYSIIKGITGSHRTSYSYLPSSCDAFSQTIHPPEKTFYENEVFKTGASGCIVRSYSRPALAFGPWYADQGNGFRWFVRPQVTLLITMSRTSLSTLAASSTPSLFEDDLSRRFGLLVGRTVRITLRTRSRLWRLYSRLTRLFSSSTPFRRRRLPVQRQGASNGSHQKLGVVYPRRPPRQQGKSHFKRVRFWSACTVFGDDQAPTRRFAVPPWHYRTGKAWSIWGEEVEAEWQGRWRG